MEVVSCPGLGGIGISLRPRPNFRERRNSGGSTRNRGTRSTPPKAYLPISLSSSPAIFSRSNEKQHNYHRSSLFATNCNNKNNHYTDGLYYFPFFLFRNPAYPRRYTVVNSTPHNHHHHHHHHHSHKKVDHCCNHAGRESSELTEAQVAFLRFARAVGWVRLADFLRDHFQLCCCSMTLLLAAAAAPYLLPKPAVSHFQNASIFLAFPIVGVSSALDAMLDITAGKVNIHVLMALAAFASVLMGNSLEGALLLAMFNLAHIGKVSDTPFDSAVTSLFDLVEALFIVEAAEEYFTSRSMIDVKELKDNHPEFALVLEGKDNRVPQFSESAHKKVPVRELLVGDYLLVRAGEAVPVDGEVCQGSSTITVEHLTGEANPLERKVGDRIPGGARNIEGMMIVKVTKSWEDSTLNKIMKLTEEGQLNKPKLQRWLDEFGELYSKLVMAFSLAVALIGPLVFKWPFFGTSVTRGSIYRALGLMVAASPCALAVAPLAYATAISSCASKGILLKGGHVLDALASCQSIAFDKTGTLTTGKLLCKAIEPIQGHFSEGNSIRVSSCCSPDCEQEALAVAAAMERGTTHPIGRAVLDHSLGKQLPSVSVESFECLPGRGLFATLTGLQPKGGDSDICRASLGSVEYIASLCKSDDESEKLKKAVKMSSYGSGFVQAALSVNKKVTLFHFEDEPRVGAADVISSLRNREKLRIMMLTGDHESSAWHVAETVGIGEVYCNLKPEDKLDHVRRTSREGGGGLIMVGDGINDAPALAAATVGIVLAQRASATAIAVADVLLLQDNISSIPFCIAKAHQTTVLVKQSVLLALSCILLAALPSVLGFLPLWLTVLLHEGGTLLVCLNSVRALKNPTWSWKQDFHEMLQLVRESFSVLFKKLNPAGGANHRATV